MSHDAIRMANVMYNYQSDSDFDEDEEDTDGQLEARLNHHNLPYQGSTQNSVRP